MRYRFLTADVFTDRAFGGNQLAVFPDARGLTTQQMQLIAREFNYSESTFVTPPVDDDMWRVRIFTPATELPFAGHPTVGTAFVLASIGEVQLTGESTSIVLQEGVGPVPVTVRAQDGRPVFAQLTAAKLPEFGPEPPGTAELAAMLSLVTEDLLLEPFCPQAVSCGVPFLFVPLRNIEAVRRARLRRDLWEQSLANYWAPQVFLFAFGGELPGSDLHARMFAPGVGVDEDPATGSAGAALAGYLGTRSREANGTRRWIAEQGFEMGRPSMLEIEADLEGGQVAAARVGGAVVLVTEGTMEVPATS